MKNQTNEGRAAEHVRVICWMLLMSRLAEMCIYRGAVAGAVLLVKADGGRSDLHDWYWYHS